MRQLAVWKNIILSTLVYGTTSFAVLLIAKLKKTGGYGQPYYRPILVIILRKSPGAVCHVQIVCVC